LFDVKISPCAAGIPGSDKVVHIGFESDRPVLASCRPYVATTVKDRDRQAKVSYHGQTYSIITKTKLAEPSP
jgi:hypothetical protein